MVGERNSAVDCLLLAAGQGSRFDGVKQLASLSGKALLEYPLTAALDSDCENTTVVLGAHADRILERIDFAGARTVRCESWQEGMAATLRAGLRSITGNRAAMILLGDQPLIGPAAINRLIAARDRKHPAVRATYSGLAAHPVLIEPELFARLETIRGDEGARSILAGCDTLEVPCDDIADPLDVDTRADLSEAEFGITERSNPR